MITDEAVCHKCFSLLEEAFLPDNKKHLFSPVGEIRHGGTHIKHPTEPCNREIRTLNFRAVSFLRLYCSQRPHTAETSQSLQYTGGLQTTASVRLL